MTESRPSWFWRSYDFLERAVVGGALGWALTIPLLLLGGLASPAAGFNGAAADYAWFATIPLGVIAWFKIRAGRPAGWLSRAVFGGIIGLCLGVSTILLQAGDQMLGTCLVTIPLGMVVWPLVMRFAYPRSGEKAAS